MNQSSMRKLLGIVIAFVLCMLGIINPFSDDDTVSQIVSEKAGIESATEAVVSDTLPVSFRNEELLKSHYVKHGIEMGFPSAEEYEMAAVAVLQHPDVLHKIEAEDGDDVYYIEETNELVIVSTDGYLRTYFMPDDGKKYFERQ